VWITLAALLAFAAIVLARLPAAWVVPAPGRAAAGCTSVEGSVWSGSCAGLFIERKPVGEVTWELHPWRLFAGRLAAHITLSSPAARGSADAEVGLSKHVVARNLDADMPLDPKLLAGLPPGLRGQAHLGLSLVELERGMLTRLQGRIEVHDLEDHDGGRATRLGSYALTFAPTAGDPVGQIKDLGGPLAVDGTLKLTRQGGFEVDGMVAPRADAPKDLTDNLRFLGSPDASGRRQFSLSGTF
jgi:general secretion pathway protein N